MGRDAFLHFQDIAHRGSCVWAECGRWCWSGSRACEKPEGKRSLRAGCARPRWAVAVPRRAGHAGRRRCPRVPRHGHRHQHRHDRRGQSPGSWPRPSTAGPRPTCWTPTTKNATSPAHARCCSPKLRWRCGADTTQPPQPSGNSSWHCSPTSMRHPPEQICASQGRHSVAGVCSVLVIAREKTSDGTGDDELPVEHEHDGQACRSRSR